MHFKIVENLRGAMHTRVLRNSCRTTLTNSRKHIGVWQQARWYFIDYRNASRTGNYRLYVLYDAQDSPVGYGALALQKQRLLITECVGPAHRGRGYGRLILNQLIRVAFDEQRELVAEIWADNIPSLKLHEQAGFELETQMCREGKEIRRLVLIPRMFIEKHRSSNMSVKFG